MKRRLLLDLFCGVGGWSEPFLARGWDCVGVDLGDFANRYPAMFYRRDVRTLTPEFFSTFDAIVMSPPCEEFARAEMPWLRGDHRPGREAIELLQWSINLAGSIPIPAIVECSKFAARHVGGAVLFGSWAFWGDVPLLMPNAGKKYSSGERPELRAKIPAIIGNWVAGQFENETSSDRTKSGFSLPAALEAAA